jgi:hypothetical protein
MYITDGAFEYDYGLFFHNSEAVVTSTDNLFKYFIFNKNGAVYVDEGTYNDDGSTYQENASLYGSAIFC